jgi:hypothetical protein
MRMSLIASDRYPEEKLLRGAIAALVLCARRSRTSRALASVVKCRQGKTFRRLGNCLKRRIGTPRRAGAPDRHIHVRIATNGGEKCGLVLP